MKAKKILTNMLCASMVVSNIIPVFATVTNDTLSFENTDTSALEETEVLYERAGSYFVTIPKTISLGADKQSPYSVKVEGDIPSDKQVYVSPIDSIKDTEEFDFYMHDTNTANPKADVIATVTQNKFYWDFNEVANGYEETDNQVTALDLTSGTWKGTFDFEINMHKVDLGIEDPETNFTLTTDGDATLSVGETHQLNAYIDGIESNSDVVWSCDNPNVIINNGLIELPSTLQAGSELTITVAKDGKEASFVIIIEEETKQYVAGLYDANDSLIVSWEKSGINNTCTNAQDIINNTYPTTKVVISNSVLNIGKQAFYDCNKLNEIIIPDSVTNIGEHAFYNCYGLLNISIPDSVKNIERWAFRECSGLTSINIPRGITSISYGTFLGCASLKDITIPNSVTSIGAVAFEHCHALANITIPNSVTSIEAEAFGYCYSLKNITIPNSVTNIGNAAFWYCNTLTDVVLPDSITKINNNTFELCPLLENVSIPNSVKSIGEGAFDGCTSLTNINIPDSVTEIKEFAFRNCLSLTDLTIGDYVTNIGDYAFDGCKLLDLTIPTTVTNIGTNAFRGVPHITYNGTATGSPWGAKSIN